MGTAGAGTAGSAAGTPRAVGSTRATTGATGPTRTTGGTAPAGTFVPVAGTLPGVAAGTGVRTARTGSLAVGAVAAIRLTARSVLTVAATLA